MLFHIAAVLTVHNRKQKTLECLKHLFAAQDNYNRLHSDDERVSLMVFITNDGCTDGTEEAVLQTFSNRQLHILQGDGNLFWAGGMRMAWQAAISEGTHWNYFLLLNDDTNVRLNLFEELFEADNYALSQYGKRGVVSGITCQPGNEHEITYGGFNFVNKTKGRHALIIPSGIPQQADLTHANILFVNQAVTDTIGIFYERYRHSSADQDYGMTARRHHFPTLVTAHICGECECDHDTNRDEIERLMTMSLAERKQYVNHPTHSDSDYLLFIRRNLLLRYPMAVLLRTIRLYAPKLYCRITQMRGVYKS